MLSLQPNVPRWCLLCLKLFFPPIDIQQALVQHTQCPCRFVFLAAKALQSQSSRQDRYTHRKCNKIPGINPVHSCVWRLCCFPGAWRRLLALSSRQFALIYNQSWTSVRFTLLLLFFPSYVSLAGGCILPSYASLAGGVCRPRSEAPCKPYKIHRRIAKKLSPRTFTSHSIQFTSHSIEAHATPYRSPLRNHSLYKQNSETNQTRVT